MLPKCLCPCPGLRSFPRIGCIRFRGFLRVLGRVSGRVRLPVSVALSSMSLSIPVSLSVSMFLSVSMSVFLPEAAALTGIRSRDRVHICGFVRVPDRVCVHVLGRRCGRVV